MLKAFRQNFLNRNGCRPRSNIDSRFTHVKSFKSIDTLTAEQYNLDDFSARDRLELSVDWFEILEKTVYPNDAGVGYYLIAEKQAPQVILPVRFTARGAVKSIQSLSNYYTSLYAPLVRHDGSMLALEELLGAVVRDHEGAHVMRFAPLDPNASTYEALLTGLRAHGWVPFRFFCFGNWFLTVSGTWQDYLKSRSANLRSSIRRRSKKFAAEGGTLDIITTPEHIEQAIAEFREIYAASWKKPEPYPDFVPLLIRKLAAMGMLRLGIARLQKRAIAAQLWFVDRDKASIYKVAYDESFSSYSPGTVLTAHIMQYVIECDQVREVDFLIGDDSYKYMWMSDRRERWGIVAYNPATAMGSVLLAKEILGRMLRSATKKIAPALSRARSFLGANKGSSGSSFRQ